MKTFRNLWIALALLFAGAFPLAAQGELIGKLRSPAGLPSCNRCTVEIKGPVQGKHITLTDVLGEFSFSDLPSGAYILRVESTNFEEAVQVVVVNDGNSLVFVDLQLKKTDGDDGALPGQVVDRSSFLSGYPEKVLDLYAQASKSKRNSNTVEAMHLFEDALRIWPDFYPAHGDLGHIYQSLGRFADAESEYRAAGRINLSSPDPLIELAGLYILRNDWEPAMKASLDAIRRDSGSARAFFYLGVALYCVGGFDTAQNAFQKALSFEPKMEHARLMLINVHLQLRQWRPALQEVDRYLAANGRGPERARVSAVRAQLRDARKPKEGLEILFPVTLGPTVKMEACRD